MQRILQFVAVLSVVGVSLAAFAMFTPGATTTVSGQAPTRTVDLDRSWNLVSWTGPETPVEEALIPILQRVGSDHTFNNDSKQFRNFSPTSPSFVNSLKMLNPGDAVWLRMTAAGSWVQPLAPATISAALTTGFNLVPWFGPDGMAVADAAAGIGSALQGVFAFVPASQTFNTYSPNLPSAVNSLKVVPFGVGLWVQVNRSVTWQQPPPEVGGGGGATTLNFPSLNLTIDIPPGALPPGVSPDDIVASNARVNSTTFTQDGAPIEITGWPVLNAVTLDPPGIEFLQPVTVTLMVPNAAGGTPFALPLTSRLGEAVADVRTDIQADGSAVVTWETTRSGTFAALEASIDFSANNIGTATAGTPFTASVTVDISGGIPTVDVGSDTGIAPLALEAAALTGTFRAPAGVAPSSIVAPASTPIAFDPPSSTVYSGTFTCSTTGVFEVVYEFALDWGIQLVLPAPFQPITIQSGTYQGTVAIAGDCQP
ncbi:MAG: hypothetical protein DK306_001285 [Chloroflexi bacterium]|nr:MAG: hypothetical protein DK306_001285 [Chloroflexota bacterium]